MIDVHAIHHPHLPLLSHSWRAQIGARNKSKHIGMYDVEREAARAYDREARKRGWTTTNFDTDEDEDVDEDAREVEGEEQDEEEDWEESDGEGEGEGEGRDEEEDEEEDWEGREDEDADEDDENDGTKLKSQFVGVSMKTDVSKKLINKYRDFKLLSLV